MEFDVLTTHRELGSCSISARESNSLHSVFTRGNERFTSLQHAVDMIHKTLWCRGRDDRKAILLSSNIEPLMNLSHCLCAKNVDDKKAMENDVISYPRAYAVGRSIELLPDSSTTGNQLTVQIVKTINVGDKRIQTVIVQVSDVDERGRELFPNSLIPPLPTMNSKDRHNIWNSYTPPVKIIELRTG